MAHMESVYRVEAYKMLLQVKEQDVRERLLKQFDEAWEKFLLAYAANGHAIEEGRQISKCLKEIEYATYPLETFSYRTYTASEKNKCESCGCTKFILKDKEYGILYVTCSQCFHSERHECFKK